MKKLDKEFFKKDCLEVAPQLIGKILVSNINGEQIRVRITETEAYRGEEDTACHAHKGKTKRTQVLYMEGGTVYVYLCYGMHWLLNVVTGDEDSPQAVLFRGGEGCSGPGKLTKKLKITGEFNKSTFVNNSMLWIEDDEENYDYYTDKRVGISYADQIDIDRMWRFILKK